ncbi:hypothetical protein, partial [Pseudomonas sp. FW305-BF6]|uniref:hypothetical protein n=1 Tax=Pseudomonas sp. FW305-BF6 TaxID=2070673 RepID=UPI001304BCEE
SGEPITLIKKQIELHFTTVYNAAFVDMVKRLTAVYTANNPEFYIGAFQCYLTEYIRVAFLEIDDAIERTKFITAIMKSLNFEQQLFTQFVKESILEETELHS